MRTGGLLDAFAAAIRWIARHTSALARWSFESSDEELPRPTPPPRPGPPHGPIPAIDLRRDPHRGEAPRRAPPAS